MLELAQLAPLHQQLDPGYPENLRTVAEWLFVQLVEDEEAAPTPERLHKLATLALRQTERLIIGRALFRSTNFLGSGVVARPAAIGAGDVDVGQELHVE